MDVNENQLLTQVVGSAPMGDLIRRYWIPALLSEEIPIPDSAPVRVHLLGEELVAFRNTEGTVGIIDEHCAHRGTSLVYGRNENCSLTCVYHGWRYATDGTILEIPSGFKSVSTKLRQRSYPCVESAGVIFAYLGPRDLEPPFPIFPWDGLGLEHTYVTKALLECNFLQPLEGECDSAHLSYLHRMFGAEDKVLPYYEEVNRYEVEEDHFGLRLLAFRPATPGNIYMRMSNFVMPLGCWVKARNKEAHFYIPIDDTHTWRYDLGYSGDRPFTAEDVHRRVQIAEDYSRFRNLGNNYLQDREMQRSRDFTGVEDFLNEDALVAESMGPILDRTKEHLTTADVAIVNVRRLLLRSLSMTAEGGDPPNSRGNDGAVDLRDVDTFAEIFPEDAHWSDYYKSNDAGIK